jgi:DNA-binding NarL/FixJ family response regulator
MDLEKTQYAKGTSNEGLVLLTQREQQVCSLLDKTNQEIAVALGISLHTVKTHVSSALRKRMVANRTQLRVRILLGQEAA